MMQKETLIKKCMKLKELQRQIDELNNELEDIKEELKKDMTDRGVDTLQAGGYTITYKPVVSSRFDSKAFKEKYLSLYESFTKEASSMRFQVK